MKEDLDDATRKALVKYRLERAHETLKEAKLKISLFATKKTRIL